MSEVFDRNRPEFEFIHRELKKLTGGTTPSVNIGVPADFELWLKNLRDYEGTYTQRDYYRLLHVCLSLCEIRNDYLKCSDLAQKLDILFPSKEGFRGTASERIDGALARAGVLNED